jgi:hypothetical protein
MRSHTAWIELLLRFAQDTPRDQSRRMSLHASAVVYRGQAAGFGFNSMKSSPFQARFGKNPHAIFIHSEIAAIRSSLRRLSLRELSRSTLYVARVKQTSSTNKNMIQGLSRPCAGCERAIATFNIKQVIWTLDGHGLSCDTPQDQCIDHSGPVTYN